MSLPDRDTLLAGINSYAFTAEIDTALKPHLDTLVILLSWKPTFEDDSPLAALTEEDVPVLGFVNGIASASNVPAERQGLVVHTGGLSVKERCQIKNWIDVHVPGASTSRHLWTSRPLDAHAITIFLAAVREEEYLGHTDCPPPDGTPESELMRKQFVLQQAWNYQASVLDEVRQKVVDVDYECLLFFERRLLERSKASGVAGFNQWGKDVGDLQQNWSPYASAPSEWFVGDFDVEDENLLKVREHMQEW